MKLNYFYILIFLFISGCNEFIDLTGKFINRINDTGNSNYTLSVSVHNLQNESLPNVLVYIVDDYDSLLIVSPKFTDLKSNIVFSLPDEQVRNISPEAQNLIIIAEHPDIGTYNNITPVSGLSIDHNNTSEFIFDVQPDSLIRANIEKYPLYFKIQKKLNF